MKISLRFSDREIKVLATALAAASQMFVKFPRLMSVLEYRVTQDDLEEFHKSVKRQLEQMNWPEPPDAA